MGESFFLDLKKNTFIVLNGQAPSFSQPNQMSNVKIIRFNVLISSCRLFVRAMDL